MLETKIEINKTALLVIDMQNDLINSEEEPFQAVTKMVELKGAITNTYKVIAAARKAGVPVIFSGHIHRKDNADVVPTVTDEMLQELVPQTEEVLIEGTPGAEFVNALKPAPGDHVILKRRSSAFYNSDLEIVLRSQGIDTVLVIGVVTDGCIANTIRGARERDLHVIVLSDCCATKTQEVNDFFITKVFPKEERVRTSDEIIAAIIQASI